MNADERKRSLLQRSNALAAVGSQRLPPSIRELYKKSLDHGEAALGLADALDRKQSALQEQPAPPISLEP
jgi:hypothetical protein